MPEACPYNSIGSATFLEMSIMAYLPSFQINLILA